MPAVDLSIQGAQGDRQLDRAALVVFGAAALLFFARLDNPLQEPDEARYAEVPRQMLETHSAIVPVLQGEAYLDKPPLLYWLVMGSYRCFGVHDWSARLLSCAAAFLTVLATWWWARQTVGRRAAFVSAVVLTLSARFVYLGRMLTPDSLLGLWTVLGWMGLHLALSAPRLRMRWWLLSAASCALGILTKGPVALVLILTPVAVWQCLGRWTARTSWRDACLWFLVMAGMAAPWYVLVGIREPAFVEHFLWKHNVIRYVAPFDHSKPFWFYLPAVLQGTLPWSLLLPWLVRSFWRTWRASIRMAPGALPHEGADATKLGFFLLACLWCLLFYSCSGSKRAVYILPVFPPLAIALGTFLGRWLPLEQARNRPVHAVWQFGTALLFAVLFVGVLWVSPRYAERFSLRDQVQEHLAGSSRSAPQVICFPRHWDSVSYYLRRQDVRAYSSEQTAALIADLRTRPATLVFIKPGDSFRQFLRELPDDLEFTEASKTGLIVKGWVRERPQWGDFPPESPTLAVAGKGRGAIE
jgi:4-amino-4-deoxy-L-arabinose transferase-like glycosyltransferase